MYRMTPEQIRQRYLLIDELDLYVPLAVLIYLVFMLIITIGFRIRAKNRGDGGWWRLLDAANCFVTFAALGYYWWRTFHAFY